MKTYLIYKFTSPSGKSYIGQTCDLVRREKQHQSTDCSPAFANAIAKHGFENFLKEILVEGLTLPEANEGESRFIAEYNTMSPNGYNLMEGGNSCEKTDEHKEKISMGRTEWFKTEEGIAWKKCLSEKFNAQQMYEVHPLLGVEMKQSSKDKMSATKLAGFASGKYKLKSKQYLVTHPDKHTGIITGLPEFCKLHGLSTSAMTNVVKGNRAHHKGFKCEYYIN
jgi:group I intron endonuclease